MNRNEVVIYATMFMNLKNILPSEKSQTQQAPILYKTAYDFYSK